MAGDSPREIQDDRMPRRRAMLYGLILVGGAIRLVGLGDKCLWVDEIKSVYASTTIEELWAYCTAPDSHTPPLRYVLVWALQRIPNTDFAIRLPAMIFGTLSIALVLWIGRMLWDWRTGVVAAVLLLLSPWHLFHSQDARYYGVMLFLALAALGIAIQILENPRPLRRWILLAICCALNVYISYIALLSVAPVLGYLAWGAWRSSVETKDRETRQAWLNGVSVAACVGLACMLPWLPTMLGVLWRYLGGKPEAAAQAVERTVLGWPTVYTWAYVDDYLAKLGLKQPAMKWALLILFTVGLGRACRHRRRLGMLVLLWFVFPVIVVLSTGIRRFCPPRYLIHFLGLYLLLAAAGATAVWDWLKGSILEPDNPDGRRHVRGIFFHAQVGLVVFAAFVAWVREGIEYHRTEKQDWRGTVRFLDRFAQPSDTVLTGAFWTEYGLRYYGAEMTKPLAAPTEALTPEQIERAISVSSHVWYVTWGPLPNDVQTFLFQRFELVHVFPGSQGDVFVYRNKLQEANSRG